MVVTGLSRSGKSFLAFDALYADGQRRHVESLSACARQFPEQDVIRDVEVVRTRAERVLAVHRLRAADALQLAPAPTPSASSRPAFGAA
jgi:hypothetical protein